MNIDNYNLILRYPIKSLFKWSKEGILLISPRCITNIDKLYNDNPNQTLYLLEEMYYDGDWHPTHKLQLKEVLDYFKNKYKFT